jgi:CRP-like cAMP-binding protein
VVGSGAYAAYRGKKLLVGYKQGDLFGELAVMYGCK